MAPSPSGNVRPVSRCNGVGCVYSPRSFTSVSARGFVNLPPSHNANYLARCAQRFFMQRELFRTR
ncbi:hypothetical protein C3D70_05060 [Cronobacter sakazakii]|nr:hypothetical protein [Cronobacter sakazakii]EGT5767477.1 hypothetical protein [Cronobacter sakazakii]PPX87296.1 hypothetical protein C3D70_05060 [Cronobacter sakazakii]